MKKLGCTFLRTVGLLAAAMFLALTGTGLKGAHAQSAISLEVVADGAIVGAPSSITNAGDGSGRLFITRQTGQIVIFDGARVLPTPFLDISGLVVCCGERGLLSVAFHPNYAANGFFYVNYTALGGATVIARYSVSADPNIANPAADLVLLTVAQPFGNHNGGQMHFGPDGMLYIGMGDGGSGGDPGNRAQDLGNLLGKMLRIDVDGAAPYAIPPDNPFVGTAGARGEIWALGLRNPWRFSFDRQTGDLFIADVGQNTIEEVSFQPAFSAGGENYGWRLMEGSNCFNPSTNCNDGSLTLPIIEHNHNTGVCSITGGYRYRGQRFPQLRGVYLYADYCSGQIWGATPDGVGGWTVNELLDTSLSITTFGEDEKGEVYVARHSFSNPNVGTIYRVTPTFPVCDLQLTQQSYTDGQTVTAQVFRMTNPGPFDIAVEAKTWLELSAASPIASLNLGADGSFVLPSGFDQDFGPVPLVDVTQEFPRGPYQYNCRLVDPVTGGAMTLDTNVFSVE